MIGPASVTAKSDLVRGMWFNQAGRARRTREGASFSCTASSTKSKSGTWVMMFPEIEMIEEDTDTFIHTDRIAPIYPLTEGVKQRELRRIMFEGTQKTPIDAPEFYPAPER